MIPAKKQVYFVPEICICSARIGDKFVRFIQTRIELKILLLLIAVLIGGFGTYVVLTIQHESEVLIGQMREKLHLFSESENLPFASVTIYDRFGREVFLREGEGIVHDVQDITPSSVTV